MRLNAARYIDIQTPSGPMRTHFFDPVTSHAVPAIMLYSEIYQMTGPIARTAAMLAGQGYLVAVPEVYHEYAEPGEAFTYDKEGTDRGNQLKTTKSIEAYDQDADALVSYLLSSERCNGCIGSMGICLGGHLAFRSAMQSAVKACVCLYATDIHKRSLGAGMNDNSLERIPEIQGALMMVWGRQDPHIPLEGRRLIYDSLTNANTNFTWHEFNGEHAFIRDEGLRYDPRLAHLVNTLAFSHFHEYLR